MKSLLPCVISFEFYPPKTADGLHHLEQAALALNALSPHFFSVTFGAGGSTRDGTLAMVHHLQSKTQVPVAPHLSCIGFTRQKLIEVLYQYRSLGVKRIVVLRGDLPSGMGAIGEFNYASELVALVREVTGDDFYIEVAAYPECHPQAKNAPSDVLNLKRKYEAGANGAITQYFFNPDAYFYFLEACAKEKIFIPIVPGIMPILHFNKLRRFSENCGAEIPRWLSKRLEAYGDDIESIQQAGVEIVSHLCQRLLAGGAPGLHFYTLNHAELSLQIIQSLDLPQPGRKSREAQVTER